MILRSLTKGVKTTRVATAQAAGTTAVIGNSVDMSEFEAVRFIALLGALTATQVTTLKAQGSADNATWVDLGPAHAGPAADADSGKSLILDLYRPTYRYIRPVVLRGTANAAVDAIIAEQHLCDGDPVAADPSVSAQAVVPYVAAGTP